MYGLRNKLVEQSQFIENELLYYPDKLYDLICKHVIWDPKG